MNRELEKASLRESLALRRAEEVEREHKQDMLQLRAQLEHLQQRFSSLAVRVQCMCVPTHAQTYVPINTHTSRASHTLV